MRKSILEVKQFKTQMHLGCEAWERETSQEVYFDVTFEFDCPPKGEETDSISDTLCYADICEKLSELTQKHYKLVEHIGHDAINCIQPLISMPGRLTVSVHKVKPPIDDLHGGVYYRCSEVVHGS